MKTATVKIALIIDENGKWAAQGHHNLVENPDWAWIDEWMSPDAAPNNPRRYILTAEVPIPDIQTIPAFRMRRCTNELSAIK